MPAEDPPSVGAGGLAGYCFECCGGCVYRDSLIEAMPASLRTSDAGIEFAAGREIARGDRVQGMAASQAEMVHRGVVYDLEVDTAHTESLECARAIAAHLM